MNLPASATLRTANVGFAIICNQSEHRTYTNVVYGDWWYTHYTVASVGWQNWLFVGVEMPCVVGVSCTTRVRVKRIVNQTDLKTATAFPSHASRHNQYRS